MATKNKSRKEADEVVEFMARKGLAPISRLDGIDSVVLDFRAPQDTTGRTIFRISIDAAGHHYTEYV